MKLSLLGISIILFGIALILNRSDTYFGLGFASCGLLISFVGTFRSKSK
jgi:hypothetical protein